MDHKDYVRITNGLRGSADCRVDAETYALLQQLVEEGKINVYFSWVHLCEALKYDGTDSEILEQYCEVIEMLTRGNCLLGPLDLRKRELEVFLSGEFNFATGLKSESIAYGKYSDALFVEPFVAEEDPAEMFNKSVLKHARNRHERKHFEKLLANPIERKKLLQQQIGNLDELKRKFPVSEDFYSIESMLQLFEGNPRSTRMKTKQFMDGISTFKNLVTHYGVKDPEPKRFASAFDADAAEIISKIRFGQAAYTATGHYLIAETQMIDDFVEKFAAKLKDELSELSGKFPFSADEALKRLKSTKLQGIPSLRVTVMTIVEYLKKHKGNLEHGRSPSESELRDLFHAVHIPYVDFFLTDRFFSTVDRKGGELYNTKVLKGLSQLKPYLENLM